MPEYLSPEWFAQAGELVAGSAALAARTQGVRFVLLQTVEDGERSISWTIRIDDGRVTLVEGAVDDATVSFTCARATAAAIHSGSRSAQAAFIAGDLRVGGDISALLAHASVFADLDDVLAPLR